MGCSLRTFQVDFPVAQTALPFTITLELSLGTIPDAQATPHRLHEASGGGGPRHDHFKTPQ